ncbi:MAG: PEP-CTERM sorting domain-containing protein [Fimbriimonadaceae bacterium]|nr:PEP-CTERM sorting domain-containing protein [Fimbriimonadaceae bacterium]
MNRLLLASLALLPAAAGANVLYDGSSGVLPDDASWGWSYAATGGSASTGGGMANLDTTANDLFAAGWGRTAPFSLDASTGFTVRFDIQIQAETHSAASADKNGDGLADRAGFSIIVLGSDAKGVELGFWQDEVWAQQETPLFIHSPSSERAFLDTTSLTRYDLTMVGNAFELKANGTTIMNGTRKDYSAFTGFPDPYETPDFLFFGDNTTSASGRAGVSWVEANPVPEPATLAVLAMGALALRPRRRR